MGSFSLGKYLAGRATAALERRCAEVIETRLVRAGSPARAAVHLDGGLWPSDALIERRGSAYEVTYSRIASTNLVVHLSGYAAAYVGWLDGCDRRVSRLSVTLSDGDDPSQARFTPSTRTPGQIAIPDPHFFRDQGFAAERAAALDAPNWGDRAEDIIWRGTLYGMGLVRFDDDAVADPIVFQRLRLAILTRAAPDIDFRFAALPPNLVGWQSVFRANGLLADPIPEETWLSRKYAIDIDGFSNTWRNLLVRMLYGCCVFKVDTQLGYRQWYYDRIKPFEHYVPVRADMSDLFEKIEWARSHQREAREIAAAGQRFAMGLDFEAGKRDAVEIITANWDKS
jgi:hypothetical protein